MKGPLFVPGALNRFKISIPTAPVGGSKFNLSYPTINIQALTYTREHFWGHMRPYICVSEECSYIRHHFGSFREWREHMENNHTREWPQNVHPITIYCCDICGSEFTYRRDLGQHIGSEHPNRFTSQELTSMVERSVITRSRGYGVCLLCNVNIFLHPKDSEVVLRGKPDSNSNILDEEHVSSQLKPAADSCMSTPHQDLDTITRHIATHLRSLALLSIRNIGDNTPSTGSGDSKKATFDSFDKIVKQQGEATDDLLLPQAGGENPRYTNPVLKAFRESIVKAYVESAIDHQDFLPQDSFQSLITAEIVQRVIKSSTEDDSITRTLAEFVIMKARKLFAILAVTGIEIIPALESLQQYDFSDDHLPITRDINPDNCKINNVDRECNHPPAFNVFHSSPWDMVMLRMFYNEQWKFLAPVFSHDRRTQKLQLKCILPFIEPPLSHEPRKSRFFSDVYQVEIHPSHRTTDFSVRPQQFLSVLPTED